MPQQKSYRPSILIIQRGLYTIFITQKNLWEDYPEMHPQDYLSEEAKFAVAAYILNLIEWIKPNLKIIVSQNQNGMKFVPLQFL